MEPVVLPDVEPEVLMPPRPLRPPRPEPALSLRLRPDEELPEVPMLLEVELPDVPMLPDVELPEVPMLPEVEPPVVLTPLVVELPAVELPVEPVVEPVVVWACAVVASRPRLSRKAAVRSGRKIWVFMKKGKSGKGTYGIRPFTAGFQPVP